MSHQDDNNQDTRIEILPAKGYSRRDFLARSAATTTGLYALTLCNTAPPAQAQSPIGKPRLGKRRGATPAARLQLPFWGDAAGWDRPEYYETLQAGGRRNGRPNSPNRTVNSGFFEQGRDTLLIRGPGGLLVNSFDPGTGQWMQIPDAPTLADTVDWRQPPPWMDPISWKLPQYYSTIQSADIDGDGLAEILARDPDGLVVWKYDNTAKKWNQMPGSLAISDEGGWNQPQYYSTLQCADIDNDNAAELIGRGGDALYVWKYDTTAKNWVQLASLPDLSDANGWNQPQYYSTIQCADIDFNGQAEIIARGPNGIRAWEYDTSSGQFNALPSLPAWSDAAGWNQPQYYSTIQFGLMGRTPILFGRGPNGIEGWTYFGGWSPVTFAPTLTDAAGWNQPQYYSTIQFVDIDGDGNAEMVARGPQGLQAWRYHLVAPPSASEWVPLPNGPAWSDAAGWNQVQYYSTIQPAYALLPGDPGYSGRAPHPQGMILARNGGFVETWIYNPTIQTWSQSSNAAFPAFTGDQLTAYNSLPNSLGIFGNGDIRSHYNDEAGSWAAWSQQLYFSRPTIYTPTPPSHSSMPPPGGVTQADWDAVTWQIYWELTWVAQVQNWYENLVHKQIQDTFLADEVSLHTVGPHLSFSDNDNTALALSILSLIVGGLAAALGFPELEAGAVASIVGVMSYAISGAELALPGQGGSYKTQYNQLQAQLADAFNMALTQLGNNLFTITGGMGNNGYVPGDYGLLSAIGQMIQTTVWNWPERTPNLTAAMQRGYATEVWKVLFQAYQSYSGSQWYSVAGFLGIPLNYPTLYATWKGPFTFQGNTTVVDYWVGQIPQFSIHPAVPPADPLNSQFNPPVEGKVFPLGVPASEFFQGKNGWPVLSILVDAVDSPPPPANTPSKLPALGVDIRTSVAVERDSETNEILLTLTHTNRGLTGATNVEVTEINLNLKRPINQPPPRHTRLAPGRQHTQTFHFATLPAGTRAVLRVTGRYLGGTFGASFRVTVP
jgi:hypothetical protein